MDTKALLEQIIDELIVDTIPNSAVPFSKGVPTLQQNVYRTISPMLKTRFELIGGWEEATHGDWLNVNEMEVLWSEDPTDSRIHRIKSSLMSSFNNWENDASLFFKENEISIFAGSEYTYERIYLIWHANVIEPMLYVYDCNGFSKFPDLDTYLSAYINNDLSYIVQIDDVRHFIQNSSSN